MNGRRGRASFFGRAGFSLILLFVAGTWFLIVRRELDKADGQWGEAIGPILAIVLPALIGIVAVYGAAVIWARRAFARCETLRQRQPNAIVLPSGRVPALVSALQDLGCEEEFGFKPKYLPYSVSLVANPQGLEMWAGSPTVPMEYMSIDWSDITGVTQATIQELGRSSRGLEVVARSAADGRSVNLPFVIVGRGIGGLFPESESAIAILVEQILGLKNTSRI